MRALGLEPSGWTGGQYSVFRALLGGCLTVHFALLAPRAAELFSSRGVLPDGSVSPLLRAFPNVLALTDAPWLVHALVVAAAAASLLLAVGAFDRAAALFVSYAAACLLGRNPVVASPSLPLVGLLLVAHALLPRAPYGSWSARGRIDPGGGWQLPAGVFTVAWIAMALGYAYSGYTRLISPPWIDGSALSDVLASPLARDTAQPTALLKLATWGVLALELLFAPLALIPRLRPWLWLAMALVQLGLLACVDFADSSAGVLVLHAFTFSPAWLPARVRRPPDTLFYDGTCGLCHGVVRFVLAEDCGAFRLAPQQSGSFEAWAVTDPRAADVPDSVIVLRPDGELLTRSTAVVYLLDTLGGLWRVLAWGLRAIPRPLRDWGYDRVASVRRHVFAAPTEACPLVPPHLRKRFDT